MLKLLAPEDNKFQNFKCGEVFCLSPSSYRVACCLCGEKILFGKFPDHFQKQHLGTTTAAVKLHKTTTLAPSNSEVDPIKSEEDADEFVIVKNDSIGFQSSEALDEGLEEKPIDYVELQQPGVSIMENVDDGGAQSEDADNDWGFDKLSDSDESCSESSSNRSKPGRPFKCTDCKRSYKSRRTLLNHRRIQHRIFERPNAKKKHNWPCEICPRFFKSRFELSNHLRTRCGEIPSRQTRRSVVASTTDAPTESSTDDAAIEASVDVADATDDKTAKVRVEHKCTECYKVFRREANLRTHMLKHTGIFCEICGKSFTLVGNMNIHKIRHTGIKAHKCTECDNCFFTEKELNAHMRRHTQIFPHICEVCGKKCRDGGVLSAHMRRHTGERPAECKVCGKRFFSGFDLKVHSVTHTTERPYKCDICGATFQLKKSLRVHKKLHSTTERNHECKVCGKAFAQSSGLVAHMRSHDATHVRGTLPPPSIEVGGTVVGVATFANMCNLFSCGESAAN